MEIKLYTTGCPKCRVLKNKLEERDVAFTVVDSMKTVQEKAVEFGISEVPFCEVGDSLVLYTEMMERLANGEL